MAIIHKRKYVSVAAISTDEITYKPADGQKVYLHKIGLNAAQSALVKSEVCWGDDSGGWTPIAATHGDLYQDFKEAPLKYIGDGTKEFKLLLTNDSSEAETIGGFFIGDEYS